MNWPAILTPLLAPNFLVTVAVIACATALLWLGRIDPAQGPAAQAYGVVRGLLDGGNTWVKLSGAYMRSTVHGPSYADTLPLGQALVQAAPERLVWGSDWPHTTEPPGTVNDADLVDLLQAWAGTDAVMDRILGDNPARLYGFPAA